MHVIIIAFCLLLRLERNVLVLGQRAKRRTSEGCLTKCLCNRKSILDTGYICTLKDNNIPSYNPLSTQTVALSKVCTENN